MARHLKFAEVVVHAQLGVTQSHRSDSFLAQAMDATLAHLRPEVSASATHLKA